MRSSGHDGRIGLVRAAAALGKAGRGNAPGHLLRAAWAPGVSVLIPERGTPDLLRRALEHLERALSGVSEPREIVVVVNGERAQSYAGLERNFPEVRWQYHARPLGFGGALAAGLRAVRLGGVYLHNSDMALDGDAIETLLPWRGPQVFAIASQIFFDDPDRRREETGWGDCRLQDERAVLFDRTPDPDGLVRGGLYAGGGSSLFDAALLRRFAATTRSYAPFYWEDADWGVQAWRNGLEVLFHPGSVARHRHRATVSRFYEPAEIDRIVERNRLLFELRNLPWSRAELQRLAFTGGRTVREIASWTALREIRQVRLSRRRAPCSAVDLERATRRYYLRPAGRDPRPLVLVVSPYCILPPRHGGARRTWRLCEALADRWRFMLLSDEEARYALSGPAQAGPFETVHLVGGRPDGRSDRVGRILSHSHAALQAELDRVIAVYQPDIVQVEHVELSGLRVPSGRPSVIVAHDVLLRSDGRDAADRLERANLASFAAIVACSREDAALLAPLRATVVPNGAVERRACPPSVGRRDLLFAGPFRYTPNFLGIRAFLSAVFPPLRRRFPDLGLTILGGDDCGSFAACDPLFDQPGVTVRAAVDDVWPWLEGCALTINPLEATRGSSVKAIESVAAGRVCVSTRDGARGWLDARLPGLVVVDCVADMLAPIAQLLEDEPGRLRLEQPREDTLRPFSWRNAALVQEKVYLDLLAHSEGRS
jgi:GT2 family glycosyltransferase